MTNLVQKSRTAKTQTPKAPAHRARGERREHSRRGRWWPVVSLALSLVSLSAGAHAQAPEGSDVLAQRLLARHGRDLPRTDELADPTSVSRLRWLAEHHPRVVVRARALLLLATQEPHADTRALVLRVLDSEAPALVHAAALRACASWPLDAALRTRLRRFADHPDPRLSEPVRARANDSSPTD
jgi:hypothetical protein